MGQNFPFNERLRYTLAFSWKLLLQLWPYVLGGVIIAAIFRQMIPPGRLSGIGKRHGLLSLCTASTLGIASPLCTYGTVPILFQFFKSGAPVGPALAFVVASSLANPQVLALTHGALGPWMTAARLISTFAIALGAGLIGARMKANVLLRKEACQETLPTGHLPSQCHSHSGCPPRDMGAAARKFLADSADIGGFIGLYFLIGLLISGFAKFFIPNEWLRWVLGSKKWYNIVIATTLGMPLYACGGATIPTVEFFIANDILDAGSALAFLTAGPALRLSCLAALATFMKRRTLAAYIFYIFLTALLFGMVFTLLTNRFPWMVEVDRLPVIPRSLDGV